MAQLKTNKGIESWKTAMINYKLNKLGKAQFIFQQLMNTETLKKKESLDNFREALTR